MSLLQRIADIEGEIERTQKNKATEKHMGQLKAKLAKLKSEVRQHARRFQAIICSRCRGSPALIITRLCPNTPSPCRS
jgi:uncharacterized coiled-coil DUF342 family protein